MPDPKDIIKQFGYRAPTKGNFGGELTFEEWWNNGFGGSVPAEYAADPGKPIAPTSDEAAEARGYFQSGPQGLASKQFQDYYNAWLDVLENPDDNEELIVDNVSYWLTSDDYSGIILDTQTLALNDQILYSDGTAVEPSDASLIIQNLTNKKAIVLRDVYAASLFLKSQGEANLIGVGAQNRVNKLNERDSTEIIVDIFVLELGDTGANEFNFTQGVEGIDRKKFEAILAQAKNGSTEPADDPASNELTQSYSTGYIKQCFLFSKIKILSSYYKNKINEALDKRKSDEYLYGDTIYPVNWANPEFFMKFMTNPLNLPDALNYSMSKPDAETDLLTRMKEHFKITLIKKNAETDTYDEFLFYDTQKPQWMTKETQMVDWYMEKNSGTKRADAALAVSQFKKATNRKELEEFKEWQKNQTGTKEADNFITKFNVNVTLDGTNPSTARNDVKVELSLDISNLGGIFTKKTLTAINTSQTGEFSVSDLILFPYNNIDQNNAKLGRFFKNQYDPNYNRLRLYLHTKADREKTNDPKYFQNENAISYDLALVDHDISRTKTETEGLKTTLKITYRGYSESVCSSPSLDVLINPDQMQQLRAKETEIYNDVIESNCSFKEIRKIAGELNTASLLLARGARGNLINIFLENNKMYSIDVEDYEDLVKLYTLDEPGGSFFSFGETEQEKKNKPSGYETSNIDTSINESSIQSLPFTTNQLTSKKNTIYFFYLGDLINFAARNLYKNASFEHVTTVKTKSDFATGSDYKFILGSIRIADPSNTEIDMLNINLSQIPISYDFFNEWFKETIIDKDLSSMPITFFIRSLLERLISNLLVDICFSNEISDPIMIKSTFINDSTYEKNDVTRSANFFRRICNNKERFLSPISNTTEIPSLEDTEDKDAANAFFPLVRTDVVKGAFPTSQDGNTTLNPVTYICIYPFGRNNILSAGTTEALTADKTIPLIRLNDFNLNWIYNNYSFAKTQQQGLREARYFNSSLNSITQLAAVYDFTIEFTLMINTFFPGQIVQIQINGLGNSTDKIDEGGSADISKNHSLALNIGGFYIITKVSHDSEFSNGAPEGKTVISARWIASGNESSVDLLRQERNDDTPVFNSSNNATECSDILSTIEIYRASVARGEN